MPGSSTPQILAARLARGEDPESIAFEETDASFQIAWPGAYRLDGPAFIYTDRQTRRVSTIIGLSDATPRRRRAALKFQICLASSGR